MKLYRLMPASLGFLVVLIGSLVLAPAMPASAVSSDASTDGGGYPGRGAPHGSSFVAPAVAPPAGYPLGIDVSSHDHDDGKTIDWPTERANGVAFAYIKATEGTSYVNPHFNYDYNTAKTAGIFAGAYAFGRPDLGNPTGQADHFVDNLQWATDGMTLPPFLDMEWPYISGTPTCYGLSASAMVSWISSFLSRVPHRPHPDDLH